MAVQTKKKKSNEPRTLTIFEQERPGYGRVSNETREAVACYYGGESLKNLIIRYSAREDESKYEWRVGVTVNNYDNFVEEVLEQYLEGLTKGGKVERKSGDKQLDEYLGDKSRYAKWAVEDLQPMALLLPDLVVQICVPAHDTKSVRSKQDKIDKKVFPYPVLIFPQHVHNFELNLDGTLKWITLKNGDDGVEYWDATTYMKIDKEGVESDKDEHGFPSIPFLRFCWKENKSVEGLPKPGRSMMFNVVKRTVGALSFISGLHESIHYHLFPKLVVDEDSLKKIQQQGGFGADTPIPEAVRPEGGGSIRYLEMSGKEIEVLERLVFEKMPKAVYRIARLRDRTTDKEASGIAKAFDMVPEVQVLSKIAEFLERIEAAVVEKISQFWDKGTARKIEVKYPTTFDVKSIFEVLQEVTSLMGAIDKTSIPMSPTALKHIALAMYRRAVPQATPQEMAAITKEIEEAIDLEFKKAKEPVPPTPPTPGEGDTDPEEEDKNKE